MNNTSIIASLLIAHVLSLLGFASYSVVLTDLQNQWQLSNAEAGWIASGFFIGYVLTVSMWSSLTDHLDARRIYGWGCLCSALASLGFGWWGQGFGTAMGFQILLGMGNAATYMPGLKILSDRIHGAQQSRYVAFYTSFFGLGVAGSLYLTGLWWSAWGLSTAFTLCALGPVVAAILVWTYTRPLPEDLDRPRLHRSWHHLFPIDTWLAVIRERESLSFILGYGVHCTELFGSRAWIVAFLAFSFSSLEPSSILMSAASTAALINVLSAPASILGNEIALRIGRQRWILWVMPVTTLVGVCMAWVAGAPWWVMMVLAAVYSMCIMADSATLTAGLVAATDPKRRGAAMGLYSLVGFGLGGSLGPALLGKTLDLSGGQHQTSSWVVAIGVLGLGCLLFPLWHRWIHRSAH